MNKKLSFFSMLVFAAFILIFVFAGRVAAEGSLYSVEGDAIQWELEGFPDESRPIEMRTIHLVRTTETTNPLDFSLSPLVDEQGNEFPRDMLVIQTPYDSAKQMYNSRYAQKRMLASVDTHAEIQVGLQYNSEVLAGTYRGRLHSEHGDDIPIVIIVGRCTKVTVEPRELYINACEGPKVYTAEKSVIVTVRTNHRDWVVDLSSPGLFYEGDLTSTLEPLELFVIEEEGKPISLNELSPLRGAHHGRCAVFTFKIQIETGWEHPAGSYAGFIYVDVHEKDE